jgi:hypothetical protein
MVSRFRPAEAVLLACGVGNGESSRRDPRKGRWIAVFVQRFLFTLATHTSAVRAAWGCFALEALAACLPVLIAIVWRSSWNIDLPLARKVYIHRTLHTSTLLLCPPLLPLLLGCLRHLFFSDYACFPMLVSGCQVLTAGVVLCQGCQIIWPASIQSGTPTGSFLLRVAFVMALSLVRKLQLHAFLSVRPTSPLLPGARSRLPYLFQAAAYVLVYSDDG